MPKLAMSQDTLEVTVSWVRYEYSKMLREEGFAATDALDVVCMMHEHWQTRMREVLVELMLFEIPCWMLLPDVMPCDVHFGFGPAVKRENLVVKPFNSRV